MTAEICDDAGGGRPRGGEFPRSMSDLKPGDLYYSTFAGARPARCCVLEALSLAPVKPYFGLAGFLQEKRANTRHSGLKERASLSEKIIRRR